MRYWSNQSWNSWCHWTVQMKTEKHSETKWAKNKEFLETSQTKTTQHTPRCIWRVNKQNLDLNQLKRMENLLQSTTMTSALKRMTEQRNSSHSNLEARRRKQSRQDQEANHTLSKIHKWCWTILTLEKAVNSKLMTCLARFLESKEFILWRKPISYKKSSKRSQLFQKTNLYS